MLGSLALAAFAAMAVVATTRIVINLQDQDAAARAAEFAEYRTAADERIAAAGERAAQADQRAAEATLKAESERTERLKLEAKYAPRILSGDVPGKLGLALASLKGTQIDIVSYESMGTDVALLSIQLGTIMKAVGIQVNIFTAMAGSGVVLGLPVRAEAGSPPEIVSAADQIVKALKEAGLAARLAEPYPAGQAISGSFMGPTGVSPVAKLRILVGSKQAPEELASIAAGVGAPAEK